MHTPGPWHASGDMVTAGDDEDDIAQVWNLGDVPLVTTSPELLDDARSLLEALEHEDPDTWDDDLKAAVYALDVTVRKAEGRLEP